MLHTSTRTLFQELVTSALTSTSVQAEPDVERYLIDVLEGFTGPNQLSLLHTPFVEQLGKALASPQPERTWLMRGLGDAALFVGGFASASLEARGVTRSYCVSLGSRAYWEASRGSVVLLDLASRFEAFLGVLTEVRELTALRTEGDTLELYERWLRHSSPEVLRRLTAAGAIASRRIIIS
jgi:hypothetical protein